MKNITLQILYILLIIVGFVSSFLFFPLLNNQKEYFIIFSIILSIVGTIIVGSILLKPTGLTPLTGILLFSVITYYFGGVLLIVNMAIENSLANFTIPFYFIEKLIYLLIIFVFLGIVFHRKKENFLEFIKIKKITNPILLIGGVTFIISYTLLNSYFLIPFYQKYIPSFYSVFAERLYQPRIIESRIIIFSVLSFAIMPAFAEEFLFRGFLQSSLELYPYRNRKNQIFLVLLIVSIFFASLHLSLFGFLINIPNAIVFSLLVIGTRSIFSSVITHAIGNGFFTIFSVIISSRLMNGELSAMIAPNAFWGCLINLIISISAFCFILRKIGLDSTRF
jgi:membrane protease YdiL (CAAX protease family)